MRVFIERQNNWVKLDFKGSVKQLLKNLKQNPEQVLVVRADELLTEDELLTNDAEIKILSVVSGG